MTGMYNWGVLAPGGIAESQVADMQVAGLRIGAVASRNLERAQAFAAKFNIPDAYGSYAELLADPAIDVVYVCNTQNAHLETALAVIAAGKNLLLEKPFTLNANQAAQIVSAAKAKEVFVMEAMWTRFLPNHVRLFEILAAGTIGEINQVVADHTQYLPVEIAPRLYEPELAGGSIIDLGVYPISFAHRIFGAPLGIAAKAKLNSDGLDLHTAMLFDYQGDKQAVLTSGIDSPGPVNAVILGSKGRIVLERQFYENSSFTVFDHSEQIIERYEAKIHGRGMQHQAIHVEECLAAGLLESPIMSLTETVEIMEVMDQVRALIGVTYPGE